MNENETPTPKTRTLDPEIAKLRTEHRAKVEAFRLQNASAVLLDSIKEKLSDGKLILEHRERLLDVLMVHSPRKFALAEPPRPPAPTPLRPAAPRPNFPTPPKAA
jgi:hypothetical protein